MGDLISKKVRGEFQEYLVTTTLSIIQRYFDAHDITPVDLPIEKLPSGQRRGLVAKYYASINWASTVDIRKVILVYEDILFDLTNESNTWDINFKKTWLERLTKILVRDGYTVDKYKIYNAKSEIKFGDLAKATSVLDNNHFQEYVNRINNSIEKDPSLAIGSTKELIESVLKTILVQLKIAFDKNDDMPLLLKKVQKALDLVPEDVDDAKKGAEIIKTLLSNLGQIVFKISELRNLYGTGHGKDKKRKGLTERHAKLAVGAGITLATFLLETFDLKREEKAN